MHWKAGLPWYEPTHSLPGVVVIPLCHLGRVHCVRSSIGRHVEGRDGVASHAGDKARKVLYQLSSRRDAGGEVLVKEQVVFQTGEVNSNITSFLLTSPLPPSLPPSLSLSLSLSPLWLEPM